jgi:uncharacterized protein (UPF0548 family)
MHTSLPDAIARGKGPTTQRRELGRMGLFRTTTPDELAGVPFSYPEVGATMSAQLPAGYVHTERRAVIGSGQQACDRAVAGLFSWRAQRGAGLRVHASGPADVAGTVVVLTAGLSWLGYDIPCRVVWARACGPERGFAYGTLPGHPVSGEESFLVGVTSDGDVEFTLRAFSRPATALVRLGGRASRAVQSLALDRYIAAMRRAAR